MSSDFSLLRASRDIFLIDLLEPISHILRDPGTGLHNIDNDQTNRDRDGSGGDVDGNRFSANAGEFPQGIIYKTSENPLTNVGSL